MRSICRALLVLDVLYCVLAFFEDRLPGWKMFATVERPAAVRGDDGRPFDLAAYLPRDAHVVDAAQTVEIAKFVCERRRAALVITDAVGGRWRVSPAADPGRGCVVDAD
jgi:hypothetical protein